MNITSNGHCLNNVYYTFSELHSIDHQVILSMHCSLYFKMCMLFLFSIKKVFALNFIYEYDLKFLVSLVFLLYRGENRFKFHLLCNIAMCAPKRWLGTPLYRDVIKQGTSTSLLKGSQAVVFRIFLIFHRSFKAILVASKNIT